MCRFALELINPSLPSRRVVGQVEISNVKLTKLAKIVNRMSESLFSSFI